MGIAAYGVNLNAVNRTRLFISSRTGLVSFASLQASLNLSIVTYTSYTSIVLLKADSLSIYLKISQKGTVKIAIT